MGHQPKAALPTTVKAMADYDALDPDADPFRPPAIPIEVCCLHCQQEYESYLIQWVVEESDGKETASAQMEVVAGGEKAETQPEQEESDSELNKPVNKTQKAV